MQKRHQPLHPVPRPGFHSFVVLTPPALLLTPLQLSPKPTQSLIPRPPSHSFADLTETHPVPDTLRSFRSSHVTPKHPDTDVAPARVRPADSAHQTNLHRIAKTGMLKFFLNIYV